MKIAILGAGAMGSWFGGQLALAGNAVQLLTTNSEHLNAVRANGLTMHTDTGAQRVEINIDHPSSLDRDTELVILFTKCFQSAAALESIKNRLNNHTIVLSLQNGLGNAEIIASVVSEAHTWLGVTLVPVDRVEPGIIACKGQGGTWFGPYRGDQTKKGKEFLALFRDAGLTVDYDPAIRERVWGKVAFNAGMNATCALTRTTPGCIGSTAESKEMVKAVAREVRAVAQAEGVSIDLETVYSNIDYVCEHHAKHKPSMLQDILAGKRTEIDSLNGAIVERANKHGINVPINALLATLLRMAERATPHDPE